MLGGLGVLLTVAVLGVIGWFAIGQRTFARIWLSWTVFCAILFSLLVVTRSTPTLPHLVMAWAAAPFVALMAWLRHIAWRSARDRSSLRPRA